MTGIRRLRRTMAEVHGWLGLIAGWLLYTMFLTGTAAYLRPEITRWMQPEHHAVATSPEAAATVAAASLARISPHAARWTIFLPSDRDPLIRAFARVRKSEAKPAPMLLDPESGAPVAGRATQGGEFFYRFHYTFGLPGDWGRWLAGACAMAMLAAILSGVVTHKRIFADFFTLRWGRGQRSWLDAHNAAAVLGLPYHAVITWSGLVTLATLLMPAPIMAGFGSRAGFAAAIYADGPTASRTGRKARSVPVELLVADAERRFGAPASSVTISEPGDAGSTVAVAMRSGAALSARGPSITYAAASGRVLATSAPDGAGAAGYKAVFGLHLAIFAGPAMRLLLVLLGLGGTVMVATGMLLWTRKRAGDAPTVGYAIAERLNVAVIAGLPAAMAAYLLANRLIPAEAPGRVGGEVAAFYGVWAGAGLLAAVRRVRRAWIEALAMGATIAAAVPVADIATTGFPQDPLFAGFDAAMLIVAAALAFASHRVARPRAPSLHVPKRQVPAHVG